MFYFITGVTSYCDDFHTASRCDAQLHSLALLKITISNTIQFPDGPLLFSVILVYVAIFSHQPPGSRHLV